MVSLITPTRATHALIYESLLRTRGDDLVTDVAAVAAASGSGFAVERSSDDYGRLVIALTLLAAGLPLDVVAERGGPLRDGLRVLDEFTGVERYLLIHGLTVGDFHALRERLGEAVDPTC